MTLAEKLTEVGNNRPKLYKKGALDYSPQETVSGEAIGITDISPIEHNMGVSVRGKNLFKTTNYEKGTLNPSTGEINTNNLAVLTYCLTTDYVYLKSGAYVVSNKTGANLRYICFYNTNKEFKSATWSARAKTFKFTVTEDCYVRIDVERDASVAIDNFDTFLTEYEFMMNKGTTATSYAPYIEDISTVKLYKGGKNLVSNDVYDINNWVNPSGNTYRYYFNLPVGTYTVSAEKKETVAYFYLQETTDDWVTAKSTYIITDNANNRITFTVEKGKQYAFYTQKQYFALIYNIQIEVGSSYTQYEPYIEPTIYDVSANGTVEGVNSIYPSVSLYTDTSGAVIDCTYYQDGRKVKENLTDMILSLGGVINE